MQPIGLLMKEHRLIERMIPLLEKHLQKSSETQTIDTMFMTTVIDFFTMYADKIHHGKEEDILFKALSKKPLTEEYKKIMKQLLEDHKLSREIIRSLNTTISEYINGDKTVLNYIQERIHQLITLYSRHIQIEDKQFFFPIMDYFTRNECDAMLREFFDFDKNMIHEYYHKIVETQEKKIHVF